MTELEWSNLHQNEHDTSKTTIFNLPNLATQVCAHSDATKRFPATLQDRTVLYGI
jgi:hypothetical protein